MNSFAFLKYCISNGVDMSEIVAKMDWQWLHDFAKKLLIVGFNGSTDMFRGNSGNPNLS